MMKHLDEFTEAAIEAHMLADHDEDWTDANQWSADLVARVEADCHSFWARCWFYVNATDMSPTQAGRDFALTRNGHGAGFWDGGWAHTPYAEMLDILSKCYGPIGFYLGDDGRIYA